MIDLGMLGYMHSMCNELDNSGLWPRPHDIVVHNQVLLRRVRKQSQQRV